MTTALRVALIWHDEVMNDLVVKQPRPITLGRTARATFVIPELGLPPAFAIVRPGTSGYLLTLGEHMRGTVCIDGREHQVADFVRGGDAAGGFRATPIGGRDWGVIDLDASGDVKLFFQFVQVDEPPQYFTKPVVLAGVAGYAISSLVLFLIWTLRGVAVDEAAFRGVGLATVALMLGGVAWSVVRQDEGSQASLAFSVLLHAALIFMTYQLYEGDDAYVWPGPRSLTGTYLVTRIEREEPPEPKPTPTITGKPQQEAAAAATKEPPKKTATKGDEGRQGGKGETERARDPNAKDAPPEPPKVQFFEDKNRKVLDNIINRNLATNLGKFTGIKGDTRTRGDLGFGPGTGTGVGAGEGTGTRGGSKKGGSGGGGNVEGDFVTGPGKIDTGANRPGGGGCKGADCGTGPRPVKVAIAEPSGDLGGLTAEEIQRVVTARAGVFRACYQKELNHTPGLGGKLVMRFKIGGDGSVQAGSAQTADGTTLRNEAVESCVKSNIGRLRFPAKGGVANVRAYPFVFTQGG